MRSKNLRRHNTGSLPGLFSRARSDPAITNETAEIWAYLARCECDWATAERVMALAPKEFPKIIRDARSYLWLGAQILRAKSCSSSRDYTTDFRSS
jgi:hypothetical protein